MLFNNFKILSKRAKVVSDKPAYKDKQESDSGNTIYHYDEKHLSKRWQHKRDKVKNLEKNVKKIREQYEKDLSSDDPRTRAIAAVVGVIDDTAARVGNPDSIKDHDTYGITTLKLKHISFSGGKAKLKFPGKDNVNQDLTVDNKKVIKVLKELTKDKKKDDFLFEVDGKRIWDRAINRYLSPFKISAKDLRGFHANRLMKELLKKKDFDEALEETASIVGHEKATLKNQYLLPELVEKYEGKKKDASIMRLSKRAELTPEDLAWVNSIKGLTADVPSAPATQTGGVKINSLILAAWQTLLPFLPKGSVITSGERTADDQKRILEHYWQKATGQKIPDKLKANDSVWFQVSKSLKEDYGYIVGPPKTNDPYSHLNGRALDVSGANLNQIANIAASVSNNPKLPVKFRKPVIEKQNNCVHLGIENAEYNPAAIKEVLSSGLGVTASISVRANKFLDEMGFGLETEQGDLFEKSPIFRHYDGYQTYKIHDISETEASKLAKSEPDEFFYRGLHKEYANLVPGALRSMIQSNAKFFFVFDYHKDEKYSDLLILAAELLSQQDPRAFFYFGLHKKFPELGRGAVVQLIDTNPDSFFDLGLEKEYSDLEGSAGAARNIKDPNKIEIEKDSNLNKAAEEDDEEKKKLEEYLKLREKYKRLFKDRDYKEFPPEDRKKEFWKHQFNPKEIGSFPSFWEYPKEEDPDREEKEEDLKKRRKQYWQHQLSPTRWLGYGAIPFWKYPKSSVMPVLSKRAEVNDVAGVFAVLPKEIAKQFKSLGDHDNSDPHITVIFCGKVKKKDRKLLEETVRGVIENWKPFKAELDSKVTYFPATKNSDGCKIAKMSVKSKELHRLHKELKEAIESAGIEIDDTFPDYKPHVTLEYLEKGATKYEDEVPEGSWEIDCVEIWGIGKNRKIKFDKHEKKACLSKRASFTEEEAKELAEKGSDTFFYYHLQETYPHLAEQAARNLAKVSAFDFFYYRLHETYPHLIEYTVQKLVEENPKMFFFRGFHKTYPHLTEQAAKNLVEEDSGYFFSYGLQETFPHLTEQAAKSLAEKDPDTLFFRKLDKIYPQLGELAAKNLAENKPADFFYFKLHKTYPQIGEQVAKYLAENNISTFFHYNLQEIYPKQGELLSKNLAEKDPDTFFRRELHKIYPQLGELAAKSTAEEDPKKFFLFGLHKTYTHFAELAAKGIAEIIPGYFFDTELHKIYPQLSEQAAENLAKENIVSFFYRKIHETYPHIAEQAAKNLAENDEGEFFKLNLQKTYPQFAEQPITNRLKAQKQFDYENPDHRNRPLKAKQLASKMYNQGYKTYIHTNDLDDLDGIGSIPGEICVSSWDLSRKLFSSSPMTYAAIFEGRPSHFFNQDAWSDVGQDGLRFLTSIGRDRDFYEMDENHDEAWFNPLAPGNKLVGFALVGIPKDQETYQDGKKKLQKLAEKNGVAYLEFGENPWDLKKIREKPLMKEYEKPNPMISKYKNLPEMRDYAKLKLSKRAEEETTIQLTDKEKQIFDVLLETIKHFNLKSTIRVAGGWARDKILGKNSKDIDIAIDNMSGKQFAEKVLLFARTKNIPVKSVGVIEARPEQSKHLETAVVNLLGESIDFVNLRAEKYDPETRIPTAVPGTALEDSYRRDLTINSLFYNINTGKIEDLTGKGIDDLKNKIIRTPVPPKEIWSQVGITDESQAITPKKTFMDDPLRVLRAIRFASRYGFSLAPELMEAAKDPEVQESFKNKISRERIEAELRKMITGPNPVWALNLINELGFRSEVLKLPEQTNWKTGDEDIWGNIIQTLDNLQSIIKERNLGEADKFVINFAAFLHDVGLLDPKNQDAKKLEKSIGRSESSVVVAEHVLRNLPGVRVDEIERVKKLIDATKLIENQKHDLSAITRKQLGNFVRAIGDDWENAVDILAARNKANEGFSPEYYSGIKKQVKDFGLEKAHTMKPLLTGEELMKLFERKGGKWMGDLNRELIQWQLENPNATKDDAIVAAKDIYGKFGLDKKSSLGRLSKLASAGFSDKDVIDLYKFMYLRNQLERRGDPESDSYIEYLDETMNDKLKHIFYVLSTVFEKWLKRHRAMFGDLNNLENFETAVAWYVGNLMDHVHEKDINKAEQYLPQSRDEVLKWKNTFNTIHEIYENLAKGPSRDMNSNFSIISRAIGASHIHGDMLSYIKETVDDPNQQITPELMSQLTSGKHEDFKEWNKELRRIGCKKLHLSKRASVSEEEAKDLAEKDPDSFFIDKLHKIYPKLGGLAAKNLAEKDPNKFFSRSLHITYPHLEELAAKNLSENDHYSFFYNGLHEIYPQLGEQAAKNLAENDFHEFLAFGLHKIYPQTAVQAAKNLSEKDPENFFYFELQQIYPQFGALAAKKIAEDDAEKFFKLNLQKTYPQFSEQLIKNRLKAQKQFDEENPNRKNRPLKAKQLANEMYNHGYKTYIHTNHLEDLDGIGSIPGEICVSSWDLSRKLFSANPMTYAAIFEGKPSHFFNQDVYSNIGKDGLRVLTDTMRDDTSIYEMDENHDEAWFNPLTPGNKLVGFALVGIPKDEKEYQEAKKQLQKLAEKNGVSFLEFGESPWDLKKIREKPLMKEYEKPNPMISKYKNLPEMRDYAKLKLSKRTNIG